MKRRIFAIVAAMMVSTMLGACGGQKPDASQETAPSTLAEEVMEAEDEEFSVPVEMVQIKESPDKYTYYMQSYVGLNLAAVGYTSMGGDRLDRYGSGYIHLNIVTDDGVSIDIEDDSQLQEYVIVDQSYAPNTEIKYTFKKDSDGNEYDNLIEWQNISGMDILVAKIGQKPSADAPELIEITPSADRYTYYVGNYVGKNLENFGYTSLGGDRMEQYGAAYVQFDILTEDGNYIDIDDDADELKDYVVVNQNIKPNTEFKIGYEKDTDGNEYSNLIEWQGVRVIDLLVKKVGTELSASAPKLSEINVSPDKYTHYVRSYVGKNLAMTGYTSLGGKRMDEYGAGYVELSLMTSDGSFIDPSDDEAIKQYYVVAQDIAPNTEIKLTFRKDSDGKEYSNLIDTQSIKKITIKLEKNDYTPAPKEEKEEEPKTETPAETKAETSSEAKIETKTENKSDNKNVDPDFKEMMDEYEEFFDGYVAFMKDYDPTDFSKLSEFSEMMSDYADYMEELEDLKDEDLEAADYAYYVEVNARILQKIATVY